MHKINKIPSEFSTDKELENADSLGDSARFNQSGSHVVPKKIVTHYLTAFQENKRTIEEPKTVLFEYAVLEDSESSGLVEDFKIVSIGKDRKFTIDMDEIEPEELFWLGKLFLDTAKYFGVGEESILELEKKFQKEHFPELHDNKSKKKLKNTL